jgi:hypothetical protein
MIILKIDHKEIRYKAVESIQLTLDKILWQAIFNMITSLQDP